jgi:hypothetical protein
LRYADPIGSGEARSDENLKSDFTRCATALLREKDFRSFSAVARASQLIAIHAKEWEYRGIPSDLGCEMPYHFEFDSANVLLRGRFVGKITDEVLRECYRALGKYFALTDPRASVLDMSLVTSLEVSPQTIRELANLPPAVADPSRPRCIIAASAKVFGMARMFELLGQESRPNLHVVRTEREAWAILGVSKPRFEPVQVE